MWEPYTTFTCKDEVSEYISKYLFKNSRKMADSKIIDECVNLLKENRNLILTGAPGTGKTYLAKEIAKSMVAETAFVQFHPSYDYTDFVEGLRPISPDSDGNIGFERKDGIFKEFCKKALNNFEDSKKDETQLSKEKAFEDSYNALAEKINEKEIQIPLKTDDKHITAINVNDNNNIIVQTDSDRENKNQYTISYNRLKKLSETYRDIKSLDEMSMSIYDGIRSVIGGCNASAFWAILHYLYKNESQHPESKKQIIPLKNYVFIIDEINRGDISKIFGDLFFAIDPGYRGEKGKVKTQYQNLVEAGDVFCDCFYVPENVYIIGTMNDIDRSVESMDFAMRRRFAWKEIKASDRMEMLDDYFKNKEFVDEAKERMKSLNDKIDNTEGLNSSYNVGAAYFLKINEDNYKNDPIKAWNDLWNNHLFGLLYEYLRGSDAVDAKMKELRKSYDLEQDDAQ